MQQPIAPKSRNGILAALPNASAKSLLAECEYVDLPLGKSLQTANRDIPYCYFVESGVISMVALLKDGAPVEIGIVGSEGLVGVPVLLGAGRSPSEAIVQLAATAFRIPSRVIGRILDDDRATRRGVLRYAQTLQVQIAQTAACNCRHDATHRLVRWLLMVDDRHAVRPLPLTQEYLSMMLGVRRQQVSIAAQKLQKDRLIRYRHGHIDHLDRAGLEAIACECYAVVAKETARLLR